MSEPTFTKEMLSESVNGTPILITATSSPGTLVHTAVAGGNSKDEVYIYVTNNHTAELACCVQWGGVAAKDAKQMAIPSKQGDYLVVPGHLLNNGLLIRVYAEQANLISVSGWVNRIVP